MPLRRAQVHTEQNGRSNFTRRAAGLRKFGVLSTPPPCPRYGSVRKMRSEWGVCVPDKAVP